MREEGPGSSLWDTDPWSAGTEAEVLALVLHPSLWSCGVGCTSPPVDWPGCASMPPDSCCLRSHPASLLVLEGMAAAVTGSQGA